MQAIPTYEDSKGNIVQFRRVTSLPGVSYRVIVNREIVGYMGETFRPSAANAAYFLTKHEEKKAYKEAVNASTNS